MEGSLPSEKEHIHFHGGSLFKRDVQKSMKDHHTEIESTLIDYIELSKIVAERNNVPLYGKEPYPVKKDVPNGIKEILHEIRENGLAKLAKGISKSSFQGDLRPSVRNKLCRTIILNLFRCCLFRRDELLFLSFTEELSKLLFSNNPDSNQKQSFTLPPFYQDMLLTYIKYTHVSSYLHDTMTDILSSLLQDEKFDADTGGIETPLQGVTFLNEVMKRILSSQSTIPFGIRIIAQQLVRRLTEIGGTNDQKYEVLQEIIFNNFFIPCLLNPEEFLSPMGLSLSLSAFRKLSKIAQTLRSPTFTQTESIRKYFDFIIDMDATSYMKQINEEDDCFDYLFINKSELEQLLNLLEDPKADSNDPLGKLLVKFDEQRLSQKKNPYISTHARIIFAVPMIKPNIYSSGAQEAPARSKTKETRKKLLHVMHKLTNLSNNSLTLVPSLEAQMHYWNPDHSSLYAQIHETLRCLNELPAEYKVDDYRPILEQMIEDSHKRTVEEDAKLKSMFLKWKQFQKYYHKIRELRDSMLQYAVYMQIKKHFWDDCTTFGQSFQLQFYEGTCWCNFNSHKTCKTCTAKGKVFKDFVKGCLAKLVKPDAPANTTELKIASTQLEKTISVLIYDKIFVKLPEDAIIKGKLSTMAFELDDFLIEKKYQNEAPWPFAQAELLKINSHKGAYDKFCCISKCWEIISDCVALVDDPGPDALWPIMAYVIASSGVQNLFSNIHYIALYTELDEQESARLMAFSSAVEVLKETIAHLRKEDKSE